MHSYPRRMDESNIEEFYLHSRMLLNLTKNGTLIVFAIIFIEIINYGLIGTSTFGASLLPLILLLVLGPLTWKMIERRKIR